MTVAQLIDLLETMPEDFNVKILFDGECGDCNGVGNSVDSCYLSGETKRESDDYMPYGNIYGGGV